MKSVDEIVFFANLKLNEYKETVNNEKLLSDVEEMKKKSDEYLNVLKKFKKLKRLAK